MAQKLGKSKSTWINSAFISNIEEMVELCPRIEFVVFRLFEKSSGSTASCSIGYRAGNAFMDFTACTPLRDKRSCGRPFSCTKKSISGHMVSSYGTWGSSFHTWITFPVSESTIEPISRLLGIKRFITARFIFLFQLNCIFVQKICGSNIVLI